MAKEELPEINASSMADIAFLLLTFFLIATSMDGSEALMTKLPPEQENNIEPVKLKKRDVFNVLMNTHGQLLVEGEVMDFSLLKNAAKDHINNNGDGSCTWCVGGKQDENLSRNPDKAVISLQNERGTKYKDYIKVYNELTKAYNELRDEYSLRKFNKGYAELNAKDPEEKAMIKAIKEKYPKILSEAEPLKNNF